VAVVTGASGGIGLATSLRLVEEGAHVFLFDRRSEELDAAARSIGGGVTAVSGDTTDVADLRRLYDAVAARGAGLDVLFANAGVGSLAPLADASVEQYEYVFGTNVRGTWQTVQQAVRVLNDGAAVVLNASIRAHDGWEEFGLVSASKAAILSLARTWSNELKDRGIRVNSVSPGTIDTGAIDATFGADRAAEARAEMARGVPIGRLGRAEEVAAVVAFLVGPDSSFMLGANVDVDGGEHAL
jgi:NAD(P)-dependent dehydrogenase (short-subunit alcohol dehydrogenase family)